MSIHKLTAGSGYDYLTRQVAALDATEKGHLGLASYYTERGETPGVWMGSGMAGIDEPQPRRRGDRRADAGLVRGRAASPGRATTAAAAGAGPDRAGLPVGDPAGGAVQDLPAGCVAVPGRGGETDRRLQPGRRAAR